MKKKILPTLHKAAKDLRKGSSGAALALVERRELLKPKNRKRKRGN